MSLTSTIYYQYKFYDLEETCLITLNINVTDSMNQFTNLTVNSKEIYVSAVLMPYVTGM